MATPLNNQTRDEIVSSVIKATTFPARRKALADETTARVRATVMERIPPEFAALVKGAPKEWFHAITQAYVSRPVPGTDELTQYVRFDDPIVVPVHQHGLLSSEESNQLDDLRERYTALETEETEARRELLAFLRSCRTVEQVIERMPELTKHVPIKSKPMPLVAPSNVLSRLAAAGFDQTEP